VVLACSFIKLQNVDTILDHLGQIVSDPLCMLEQGKFKSKNLLTFFGVHIELIAFITLLTKVCSNIPIHRKLASGTDHTVIVWPIIWTGCELRVDFRQLSSIQIPIFHLGEVCVVWP
jgi:hypothetical protein